MPIAPPQQTSHRGKRGNEKSTTTGVGKKLDETSLLPGTSRFSRPRAEFDVDGSNSVSSSSIVNGTNNNNIAANIESGGKGGEIRNKITNDIEITESDICQQLLVSGYVQSYVDFYHLTNRADPNANEGLKRTKIRTSPEDMIYIRDNLIAAETSRRQGNTTGVYTAYNNLAELYRKHRDWRTSIFFHEKRLEISQLTSDDRAMMSANHSLGTVYHKMGEIETARRFHERHEEIAKIYDVIDEVAKANTELYKVYMVLATRYEHESMADEALEMFLKCLESAKKCWDRAAEGETNGKIGILLLHRGDALGSLPYLKQQSQTAADMSDAEGRCRACSSLALAYDILGQAEKALVELNLVHTISEQAGDAMLQAQACKALGTLYSKVGKLEQAVESFQRHFTLVKALISSSSSKAAAAAAANTKKKSTVEANNNVAAPRSDALTSQDLDLARVFVGISKGNLFMGAYVVALQLNLTSLLDWKLNRSELTPPQQLFMGAIDNTAADEGVVLAEEGETEGIAINETSVGDDDGIVAAEGKETGELAVEASAMEETKDSLKEQEEINASDVVVVDEAKTSVAVADVVTNDENGIASSNENGSNENKSTEVSVLSETFAEIEGKFESPTQAESESPVDAREGEGEEIAAAT